MLLVIRFLAMRLDTSTVGAVFLGTTVFGATIFGTARPGAAIEVTPQTPVPSASPSAIFVRGQFLTLSGGYLIFTTGDALAVDPALHVPPGLRLGVEIRATLDPATHRVVALEPGARNSPGDIDIARVPREYVVVDPRSAHSLPSPGVTASPPPASVTITIEVRVPGSTPLTDDVYLSTDRSGFNPSEIKMVRVDASHWTAQLRLPAGSRLRYDFTRGSFSNLERTNSGAVVTPRSLLATDGERTDDTVESWADSQ
jgi:hypothetical protein